MKPNLPNDTLSFNLIEETKSFISTIDLYHKK